MILKGLFRRYERWNPVHPTSGAFWGMGLGIGCGVGWGPGFGPEVVGYVGAGCGVGFSVGITFAGFGIGLPAGYLFEVPYNVVVATTSGALTFAQSSGLLSSRKFAWNGLNSVAPHISILQAETGGRFSNLHRKVFPDKGVNLFDMKSKLLLQTRSLSESLGSFNLVKGKGVQDSPDCSSRLVVAEQSRKAFENLVCSRRLSLVMSLCHSCVDFSR